MELAEELERQIDEAMVAGRDYFDDEVATSVRYVSSEDFFLLVLRSGRRIGIPREDLQYVADLSTADAADVGLVEGGTVVEWRGQNVDFSVKALADGLRGSKAWMAETAERQSPAYAV